MFAIVTIDGEEGYLDDEGYFVPVTVDEMRAEEDDPSWDDLAS
jgi:hypothetical protein